MNLDFIKCLEWMVEKGASDLHLKVGIQPVLRYKTALVLLSKDHPKVTKEDLDSVFEAILKPYHKNVLLEERSVDFSHGIPGLGRFRFNIFYQRNTPRVVVRHIPHEVPKFEDLNLPLSIQTRLDKLHDGLVIIAGATGAGKSTTAVSMINRINETRSRHIITIEDPIEFLIQDNKSMITQRELGTDYYDYKKALKHALRQDADIIFLGELRDVESAETAINAANTGHLVITTLHTNNVAETLSRLLGMFNDDKAKYMRMELGAVLQFLVCQKLLETKDGKNVVPATEILVNNARVRSILENAYSTSALNEIIEEGQSVWGMQSFNQSIISLHERGLISKAEGLKKSPFPETLRIHFDGVSHKNRLVSEMDNTATGTVPRYLEPDLKDSLKTKKASNS